MSWEAELKELGEVCSFQRGLTYAKGDEVDLSKNVVLRANNISMATNALDFAELKYIKDSIAIPESKLVRRDTLMICTASGSKSHLGKVAYVDDDYGYAFGGFMGLLVPEREVRGRYLYYAMLSEDYKEFIDGLSDGVNINNLKWDDLKSFTFPVPPLPEQQRIVGVLDAAFAALGEAEGLVARNRANARELFESYLNGVFEGKGDGWVEKRLGDLIDIQNGYAFSSNEYKDEGYFLIRISNVQDGEITLANPKYVAIDDPRLQRFVLNEGDILVSLTGNIGRVGVIQAEHLPAALNQRVARITLKDEKTIRHNFLFFFLRSNFFREHLQAAGHGAAQQNVSTKEIAEVELSLPPLAEQQRVLDALKELQIKTDELEATYQQKLMELAGLKKAVLGAAFRGEL